MEEPTRLLLVADQHNAALMEKALRRARLEFEYGRVDTPGLLLAALQGGKWDIIAHRWGLRQVSLNVANALLRNCGTETALIVVTDQGDDAAGWMRADPAADEVFAVCKVACLPVVTRLASRELKLRRALQGTEPLLRARDLYVDLLDRVPDIVYAHDPDGTFTAINKAAERIGGYSRAEIIGRNFADFVAPEYLEIARRGNVETSVEAPTVYELEVVAKDGSRIRLEISSWLIVRDGKAQEVHGTARHLIGQDR